MSKKVTSHGTGVGDIVTMWLNRPKQNEEKGKNEYLIKLRFDENEPESIALRTHLSKVSPAKIVTRHAPDGTFFVKFTSFGFPKVIDKDGNILAETLEDGSVKGQEDLPAFNWKTDTGKASVVYSVIADAETGFNTVVLEAIKIYDLNITPYVPGARLTPEKMDKLLNEI